VFWRAPHFRYSEYAAIRRSALSLRGSGLGRATPQLRYPQVLNRGVLDQQRLSFYRYCSDSQISLQHPTIQSIPISEPKRASNPSLRERRLNYPEMTLGVGYVMPRSYRAWPLAWPSLSGPLGWQRSQVPLTREGPARIMRGVLASGCDIFTAPGAPGARVTAWPWYWRAAAGYGGSPWPIIPLDCSRPTLAAHGQGRQARRAEGAPLKLCRNL